MDIAQDSSDAQRDWLGSTGRITATVMLLDPIVVALVLYFVPPAIGIIFGGPDYSSYGTILIISIYSSVIYILSYFLVFRRFRTNEIRKLVTPAAILAFFSVTTILFFPVGICLSVIAYLASKESKTQFFELHGHYENETVYSSLLELGDDSAFHRIKRLRRLIAAVGIFPCLLFLYQLYLFLNLKSVPYPYDLIALLATFCVVIVGVLVQYDSFKKLFPLLPGREGTVKKIRKSSKINCVVTVSGITFRGYCATDVQKGDSVVVRTFIWNRDDSQKSHLTVELAHKLIR